MKKVLIASLLGLALPAVAQIAPDPPKPVMVEALRKTREVFQPRSRAEAGVPVRQQRESQFHLELQTECRPKLLSGQTRPHAGRGHFEAKSRNRYCLAWENRSGQGSGIDHQRQDAQMRADAEGGISLAARARSTAYLATTPTRCKRFAGHAANAAGWNFDRRCKLNCA